MENQHRKIKGYRELTQEEIDLMNEIKQKGIELGDLFARLQEYDGAHCDEEINAESESYTWLITGKTHLQQGLMAWTRAVAKPEFF